MGQTHGRDHLRTEAETGVMRPQAKDAWGHGRWKDPPLTSHLFLPELSKDSFLSS